MDIVSSRALTALSPVSFLVYQKPAPSFWSLPLRAMNKGEPLFQEPALKSWDVAGAVLPLSGPLSFGTATMSPLVSLAIQFAFPPFPLERFLLVSCTDSGVA